MTHYSRDAESAAIMALAPVIPVLTVRSVEDGLGQARALVAGGLFRHRSHPAHAERARRHRRHRQGGSPRRGRRRHHHLARPDRRGGRGGGALSGEPGHDAGAGGGGRRRSGPFLPGCATASEAMALRELGFRSLKLFPAEAVGGVKLIASLAAPLADLRFCPTGGIDLAKAPGLSSAAQRRLHRRLMDAAEGRAGGRRLRHGGEAGARGGGAEAGERDARRAVGWPSAALAARGGAISDRA